MPIDDPRIAVAPISWGLCEVPGWGEQLPAERVLREARSLGVHATEAGPDGFLPEDPVRCLDMLASYGLRLVGGFTPLVLHRTDHDWRPGLEAVARRFSQAEAEVVVVAALAEQDNYDLRPTLDGASWRRLCAALDEVTERSAAHGLRAVLHHHVGTVVETADDISKVLAGSGMPLCLDTGHALAAGYDPLDIVQLAPDRIGHVHLKDVDPQLASLTAAGDLPFTDAVRLGLFRPLGTGAVDLDGLIARLRVSGYDGWFVHEQDVRLTSIPAVGEGPVLDAAHSLRRLRAALEAA